MMHSRDGGAEVFVIDFVEKGDKVLLDTGPTGQTGVSRLLLGGSHPGSPAGYVQLQGKEPFLLYG